MASPSLSLSSWSQGRRRRHRRSHSHLTPTTISCLEGTLNSPAPGGHQNWSPHHLGSETTTTCMECDGYAWFYRKSAKPTNRKTQPDTAAAACCHCMAKGTAQQGMARHAVDWHRKLIWSNQGRWTVLRKGGRKSQRMGARTQAKTLKKTHQMEDNKAAPSAPPPRGATLGFLLSSIRDSPILKCTFYKAFKSGKNKVVVF